jgi:hypothetical protein
MMRLTQLRRALCWLLIAGLFGFATVIQAGSHLQITSIISNPTSLSRDRAVGSTLEITIKYRIAADTEGNVPANVQLSYYLPAGLDFIRSEPPETRDGSMIFWKLEQVGDGEVKIFLEVTANFAILGSSFDHKAEIKVDNVPLAEKTAQTSLTTPTPAPTLTPSRPKLEVEIIDINPETIRPGETATLTVTIKNEGSGAAQSGTLVLKGAEMFEWSSVDFNSLPAGQSETKTIQITARGDIEDDEYEIVVEARSDSLAVSSEAIEVRVERPSDPQYTLRDSKVVPIETPGGGVVELRFVLGKDSEVLPGASLVLEFAPGTMSVSNARFNNQSLPITDPQNNRYSWLLPAEAEWQDDHIELILTVQVKPELTTDSSVRIFFVNDAGAPLSGPFDLDQTGISALVVAKAIPTATPTMTPTATPTAITGVPVVETTPVVESTEIPPIVTPERLGLIGSIRNSPGIMAAVAGMGILVVIGGAGALWMRSRNRSGIQPVPGSSGAASSPITGVLRTPVTGVIPGAPYLQRSSDGCSYPLTQFPFTIGRGEGNSLQIDDSFPQWQTVSRRHAHIVQHGQGYVIEDLGSQNKLRVQGRLTEKNLLRNGWQVVVGSEQFVFYDGSNISGRQS